jgi:CheY-like chemotaxis protein
MTGDDDLRQQAQERAAAGPPRDVALDHDQLVADDRLLSKPFGQHELGVAVRAVLDPLTPNEGATPRARHALVVDDDPDVAATMGDALNHLGLSATIARSGTEAIALASALHPDLILCDVRLGSGLSGYDLARAVRADPQLRHITLLAMTGLPPDQSEEPAKAAGFDHVLTKPVELDRLEALIKPSP